MPLTVTRTNWTALKRLPTAVRPRINTEDIEVPQGYEYARTGVLWRVSRK